ncbi:7482_t:CDS:2, partial [Funneliformis mosseae]
DISGNPKGMSIEVDEGRLPVQCTRKYSQSLRNYNDILKNTPYHTKPKTNHFDGPHIHEMYRILWIKHIVNYDLTFKVLTALLCIPSTSLFQ